MDMSKGNILTMLFYGVGRNFLDRTDQKALLGPTGYGTETTSLKQLISPTGYRCTVDKLH